MENKNVPTEQTEEIQDTRSQLNKVTPLSKYLAMGLFVALPFLGGWIGYQYAPEKVVEVEKVLLVERTNESKGPGINVDDLVSNSNSSTFKDEDYGFSFDYSDPWNYQIIDENYGLHLPASGLKHILVTKAEREQGLIVSIVKTENLSDFFGCFEYKYNSSLEKWERQDATETDRCFDERNVRSHEKLTLEANYMISNTPSLKTSGSNPTNVLIPLTDSYGFNVTYINWQGELGLGEIPPEAKTIIDSLRFLN
jgi:hypothetical protein